MPGSGHGRLPFPRRANRPRPIRAKSAAPPSRPSPNCWRSVWDARWQRHEKTAGTTLDELGLDSLDRMDLALQIEDRFGFRSPQVATSVGELWAVAEGLVAATDDVGASVPALWRKPPPTTKPVTILADTIPEAFVRRALEDPAEPCVADRLSGTLDYRRMLVARN